MQDILIVDSGSANKNVVRPRSKIRNQGTLQITPFLVVPFTNDEATAFFMICTHAV